MDEERLRRLKEQLECEENRGIGLGNIYKRIRAMYPGGSVEVYSRKNAGTVIKIEIPRE